MFGPVMDRVASQGVNVKKINVDYEPDVITKFGVKSVPTVILVENEQEVNRFVGAKSEQDVINFYNG
jgi:thioredoxin-like negative regulator of GroEL